MRSRRVFLLTRVPPRRDLPQIGTNPRNVKVSGLPRPRRARLAAAWRPNSIRRVLSGCEPQREFPHPIAHRVPEAPGIVLMLESDDNIVGIPYDDHVAGGLTSSPTLGPKVEEIMEVDVREQR